MYNGMFFVLLCQLIPQVKTQPPVDLHRIYKKFNLVLIDLQMEFCNTS